MFQIHPFTRALRRRRLYGRAGVASRPGTRHMPEQEPSAPADVRVALYKTTAFDRIARWAFWIAFATITIGALVWVRLDGQ
jgi:hypothetical protein